MTASIDRTIAVQELYHLMLQYRRMGDKIGKHINFMRAGGIEDAKLIQEVIKETLLPAEERRNREINEERKDAIYAEFFSSVGQRVSA